MFASIGQDLRFAIRSWAKRPGVAAACVMTLGLGIGANAAVFSVVKGVLLSPFPYEEPERITMIWSRWTGFPKTWVSIPEYQHYLQEAESFEDIALFARGEVNLSAPSGGVRIRGANVTPNTFRVLGVQPIMGRTFTQDEVAGNASVILISYGLWQSAFSGDPKIVGKDALIEGRPQTIIGVMPPGFRLPIDYTGEPPTRIWGPLFVNVRQPAQIPRNGGSHSYYAAARLKQDVAPEAAQAEMSGLLQRLVAQGIYDADRRFEPLVIRLADDIVGHARPALLVLSAAVAFVLMIACANVANLLLAQGRARQREYALRCALGAGRGRLFRQSLTEGTLLAAAGGVVGLGIAFAGVTGLMATDPESLPRVEQIGLDLAVLLFVAAASLATALLFGIAPAVKAAVTDVQAAIREGERGFSGSVSGNRFQFSLVAAQAALAVVLTVGAGLAVRSFANLASIQPGFDAERVLTVGLRTTQADYPTGADVAGFYSRLLSQVRAQPGVVSAGAARRLPLATQIGDSGMLIENKSHLPAKGDWQIVTPGYFETLGIPLRQGRLFTDSDDADAPQAIIINEAMARAYWPGENPLGRRVKVWGRGERTPWMTIVGIVADIRHNGITAEIKEKWYRPHAQFAALSAGPVRSMSLTIKTDRDPSQLIAPLRDAVGELDPGMPLAEVRSYGDILADTTAQPRFTMILLGAFSAMALGLAAVGAYGTLSYAVSQRTMEIGVRMAMGARTRQVAGAMVGKGMTIAALGAGMGIVASLGLTRLMQAMLFEVPAWDPASFIAAPTVFLATALLGCYLPARRAASVDPATTLRQQ